MIQQDAGVKTALLLQRIFVCPNDNEMTNEEFQALVTPVVEHVIGQDDYHPVKLQDFGNDREVVLYAETGRAVLGQQNDSLKAVYIARGFFEKTAEIMNRLRSRGTFDFEGKLQIAFMTELAVTQIEETGGLVNIERNTSSEPVLVNRIDGEQSDLFSRIEQVLVLCPVPVGQGQSVDSSSQLEFEDLTRVEVSTRNEMEPIRYQVRDIESAVTLGEGVLTWPKRERNTDRYGFITLSRRPHPGSGNVSLNIDGARGKDGSLLCQIIENRESLIMDQFRGFFAQTPEVGEIIELGKGAFRVADDNSIGLEPDDGREIDWLNPRALYLCHLQTVRLLFLPSSLQDC